jgi:acetyltransferase
MFRQAGIVEIREIHETVDFVKAFQSGKRCRGRRVAVMGGSGGSAIVFADAAERAGLVMSELSAETTDRLSRVIPAIGSVHNPVDFTAGYIAGGNGAKFRTAVQAVIDDVEVDAVCINFATIAGDAAELGAVALSEIARGSDKPLVTFVSTPHEQAAGAFAALAAGGIPALPSPVRAAKAIAALAAWPELRREAANWSEDTGQLDRVPAPIIARRMSESRSKAVLEHIGISVTRDMLVQSAMTRALCDCACRWRSRSSHPTSPTRLTSVQSA